MRTLLLAALLVTMPPWLNVNQTQHGGGHSVIYKSADAHPTKPVACHSADCEGK